MFSTEKKTYTRDILGATWKRKSLCDFISQHPTQKAPDMNNGRLIKNRYVKYRRKKKSLFQNPRVASRLSPDYLRRAFCTSTSFYKQKRFQIEQTIYILSRPEFFTQLSHASPRLICTIGKVVIRIVRVVFMYLIGALSTVRIVERIAASGTRVIKFHLTELTVSINLRDFERIGEGSSESVCMCKSERLTLEGERRSLRWWNFYYRPEHPSVFAVATHHQLGRDYSKISDYANHNNL